MQSQAQRLLQCTFTLIRTHGFTREALALSALSLPTSHNQPLSDTAINALFGRDDDARRRLISAWLEEGVTKMQKSQQKSVSALLKSRLRWNDPVLPYLPEAFALMASPPPGVPLLDPSPAIRHVASIADQVCYLSGDQSTGNEWYIKRATLAAVYAAAELHQFASPTTADDFLDGLLQSASELQVSASDTTEFARYIGRSWASIIRSLGST